MYSTSNGNLSSSTKQINGLIGGNQPFITTNHHDIQRQHSSKRHHHYRLHRRSLSFGAKPIGFFQPYQPPRQPYAPQRRLSVAVAARVTRVKTKFSSIQLWTLASLSFA